MVMLHDSDVQTREVLGWKGIHLFHFAGSSCSQKLRIYLRLKGIAWQSHHLNLARREHTTPYYMGINPRGLVPCLVDDGKVIIESNDILLYLEQKFPDPPLVPKGNEEAIAALLRAEDDLHFDLRALTMRFVFPTFLTRRPESELARYEANGSGMVEGRVDPHRHEELAFWRGMLQNGGITDRQAVTAFDRFEGAFSGFESTLDGRRFLLGDDASTLDIAWYIYCRRLLSAGYPLTRRHPRLSAWFARLDADRRFHDEVPSGGIAGTVTALLHIVQKLRGTDLESVAERRRES